MRLRWIAVLAAIALCLAVPEIRARVFWRSVGTGDMIDTERVGWREAFSGEMELDGETVAVQVLAARTGSRTVLKRIEAHFENRGAQFAGGAADELGWGIALWENRRAHILVLAPAALRNSLVFVFHYDGLRPSPRRQRLIEDLAVYPGAELVRTVRRAESGLNLEFFSTPASAPEVLDHYQRVLMASGWQPLIADRQGRALPRSLLYFVKGKRVLCISVESSGMRRGNLITVLQKN